MPFFIEGNCVKKRTSSGSSKTVKCHDTLAKAKKHLVALNINVRESEMLPQLNMTIVKASREKEAGTMRLRLVNSDTGEDSFGESMSMELFNDFVRRSDENLSIPKPFTSVIKEETWEGGPPYLSIAHYKSAGGKNVPGEQEKLYIDGEKLKSVDILYDTPLGNAVWKSVYDDLYAEEKAFEDPVRISIGFLDLEHKHVGIGEDEEDVVFTRKTLKGICKLCAEGIGNKVYLKGHLVHKAFTRVPAHPRTMVEVEEMAEKSSGVTTKKKDANSIIGDLSTELEEKSTIDENDAMVIKADDKDLEELAYSVRTSFYNIFVPSMYVRTVTESYLIVYEADMLYRVDYESGSNGFTFAKRSAWELVEIGFIPVKSETKSNEWKIEFKEKENRNKSTTEEVAMTEKTSKKEEKPVEAIAVSTEKAENPVEENPVDEKDSILKKSFDAFIAKKAELETEGIYGDEALKELQPFFNKMGEVTKEEVQSKDSISVDAIKKALREVMPELFPQFAKYLGSNNQPIKVDKESGIPSPRSINVERALIPEDGKQELSQIQKLARKGLLE